MILFKRIEIDLENERKRIEKCSGYTKHQKAVLYKLVDLFEKGEWQKCLDFVNNKKNFPYNNEQEYPETEHIGIDIVNILRDVRYYNYYTAEKLTEAVKKEIEKDVNKTIDS